jgi:HSP20 family protein
MNLVRYRYSPIRELERMENLFDRLFPWDRSFLHRPEPAGTNGEWRPAIDLGENGDSCVVRADLPGLKKEDLKVSVEGDLLTIRGEIKGQKEEKQESYLYCERGAGSFQRTIRLPSEVDATKVKASLSEGILEVKLPKREELKVKEIPVDIQ